VLLELKSIRLVLSAESMAFQPKNSSPVRTLQTQRLAVGLTLLQLLVQTLGNTAPGVPQLISLPAEAQKLGYLDTQKIMSNLYQH
jgi:hypothetical protein